MIFLSPRTAGGKPTKTSGWWSHREDSGARITNGKLFQAAFWYGLVVHLRIYPIIYALPIVLALSPCNFRSGKKPVIRKWSDSNINSAQSSTTKDVPKQVHIWLLFTNLFARERISFVVISGTIFFFFTGIFFYLYEWEFLHEALLYHLTRTDPRHNFSIYFYHICLHYEQEFSLSEKLVSFLPQFIVQLVLISRFRKDLPFYFFLQTVAFVAFNKVITAQYFVWFFCLLPLILPWSNMTLTWGLLCIFLWIGAQTHWLLWGFILEFKGNSIVSLTMADGQVINPSSSVPAPLPPYPELILAAIEALDKGKGVQEKAISKHIEDAYGPMPEDHSALLSHHLNRMKQSGELFMLKNNYMKADCDEFPFPPYPVLIVEAIEALDKENGASKRTAHHLNK